MNNDRDTSRSRAQFIEENKQLRARLWNTYHSLFSSFVLVETLEKRMSVRIDSYVSCGFRYFDRCCSVIKMTVTENNAVYIAKVNFQRSNVVQQCLFVHSSVENHLSTFTLWISQLEEEG